MLLLLLLLLLVLVVLVVAGFGVEQVELDVSKVVASQRAHSAAGEVELGEDEIERRPPGPHVLLEQSVGGPKVRHLAHARVVAVQEVALALLVELAQTLGKEALTVGDGVHAYYRRRRHSIVHIGILVLVHVEGIKGGEVVGVQFATRWRLKLWRLACDGSWQRRPARRHLLHSLVRVRVVQVHRYGEGALTLDHAPAYRQQQH